MIKGFILFEDGRIPFVEQNYKMELFSDNHLLKEFSKQYNLKTDYILKGLCFIDGSISQVSGGELTAEVTADYLRREHLPDRAFSSEKARYYQPAGTMP